MPGSSAAPAWRQVDRSASRLASWNAASEAPSDCGFILCQWTQQRRRRGIGHDRHRILPSADSTGAPRDTVEVGAIDDALTTTVGLLVALAAFARSAQFPLHTWLPYTMEGPTPVSALMHAGIVNAGGFLINRFAPLFVHTSVVLHVIFAVGLVTAVLGSILMLTQNDIKKALGYSTMGQMGFMFVECGVGAFSLAIYHLIAHGMFKGTLFLGAGSVIGNARKHDGVPQDDVYTFVVERKPAISRVTKAVK